MASQIVSISFKQFHEKANLSFQPFRNTLNASTYKLPHKMEDRRPAVIIVPLFMGIIAVASVGLRFYARRIKKSPLGSDDYTIAVAMVDERFPES